MPVLSMQHPAQNR